MKAHRLPHDTPSQLADSFRIGWMACRELAQADSVQEDAARYRWLRRCKGQEHEPPFTVQHEMDGALWGGDLDAAIDDALSKLSPNAAAKEAGK